MQIFRLSKKGRVVSDRKLKLEDLPIHMRSVRWIEAEIKYESKEGVHTYHLCEQCNVNNCRDRMCATCWQDLIKEAKE